MKRTEHALIVAGGKGTRIKSKLPKQFIAIAGKPVILHTLEAFFRYSSTLEVVLVLPESDISTWETIAIKHGFNHPVTVARGGESRFQSVRNGLDKLKGPGLVAIHDGVRPLVSPEIISASFSLAAIHHGAVASVRLKESLRFTDQDQTRAVDRSRYRLIQTPQTFDLDLIKKAYRIREDPSLTDDASVFELAGNKVSLFEGSYENIKITTPGDLVIAEALLQYHGSKFREGSNESR